MKLQILLIPALLAAPQFVCAMTDQESSLVQTCFVASDAIEIIVKARQSGHKREEVKERTSRMFSSTSTNLAAYLVSEVDQVYSLPSEDLPQYGSRHNSECVAARAPTVNREKVRACYLYARFVAYLARSRDEGVTRAEQIASTAGGSTEAQQMAKLAIQKVYENPSNKFAAPTEYNECLNSRIVQ